MGQKVLTGSFSSVTLGRGRTIYLRGGSANLIVDVFAADSSGAANGALVGTVQGVSDRREVVDGALYYKYVARRGSIGSAVVWVADDQGVPAQLAELYANARTSQGEIPLPPSTWYLATGAPLAIFANGASAVPGSAVVDSKAFGIRWNNHATPNAITRSFPVPPDADLTADMVLHVRASKVGATLADATTFTVEAYNQVDAALHDADGDFGGTSSAMVGDATSKTIQNVSLTLASANLAAGSVTLLVKPTAGLLGTDDLVIHDIIVLYTKKLLAS